MSTACYTCRRRKLRAVLAASSVRDPFRQGFIYLHTSENVVRDLEMLTSVTSTAVPGNPFIFNLYIILISVALRPSLHTVTLSICTGTDTMGAFDVDTLNDSPPAGATHSLVAGGF